LEEVTTKNRKKKTKKKKSKPKKEEESDVEPESEPEEGEGKDEDNSLAMSRLTQLAERRKQQREARGEEFEKQEPRLDVGDRKGMLLKDLIMNRRQAFRPGFKPFTVAVKGNQVSSSFFFFFFFFFFLAFFPFCPSNFARQAQRLTCS
jgi:hypothetical protein